MGTQRSRKDLLPPLPGVGPPGALGQEAPSIPAQTIAFPRADLEDGYRLSLDIPELLRWTSVSCQC